MSTTGVMLCDATPDGTVAELFEIQPTGLKVHGAPTIDEWLAFGEHLHVLDQGLQFAIGDYLNYGERSYGEKYSQTALMTGYSAKTLTNFAYVANAVEPSRRRENVPFSHHAEVAPLNPEAQEKWLEQAAEADLTRDQLRAAVKADTAATSPTSQPATFWLTVSCASAADMETLANRFEMEGRSVKRAVSTKAKAA